MIPNHPKGLPYIVGNEAAERFSFYGMKAILIVFMTTYLMDSTGALRTMPEGEATFWYHIFGMANYVVPVVGAIVADTFWGKYKTIIVLSVVYCLGHLALALDETRVGLSIGLALIAIGSGGIKPCVSAHLGDQYRDEDGGRISEGYSLFYIAINIGAFLSTLMTPVLLDRYGPNVAFGVPGVLMAFATLIFWRGRRLYVVQPPTPWRRYLRELIDTEHRLATARILLMFGALSVFWALFDQTGSSWVLQAEHMNRRISLPFGLSFEVLPSQIQALNPILILVFAPLFTWGIYPALSRRGVLSTRGKIATGMVIAAIAFSVVGYAQGLIATGGTPSIWWQVGAYFILTIAEVVVSITALELAYTAALSTHAKEPDITKKSSCRCAGVVYLPSPFSGAPEEIRGYKTKISRLRNQNSLHTHAQQRERVVLPRFLRLSLSLSLGPPRPLLQERKLEPALPLCVLCVLCGPNHISVPTAEDPRGTQGLIST